MYFWLCFVLGWILFNGGYSAHVQPEKVVAFAGGDAILPCSLKIPVSDHVPTVEWSKERLNPDVVFLYRDGYETFEMKNVDFEFRTNLFMREVKNGNVSLRISNVKLSDAGIYQCLIIKRNKATETTKVELDVAPVSDPKLTVVFVESKGATVACEASCWLPAPLIVTLVDKGNDITDEEPNQEQDPRRCYTSRQTLSTQDSTRRIVCSVNQPQTDQNQTGEIVFSVSCTGFNCNICWILGGICVILVLFGISFCIWWTCSKNARKKRNSRNSSDSDLKSVTCESSSLLTIKDLKTEIDDLKSESSQKDETIRQKDETIRQKDETIRKLRKDIHMGDVYQHDKPTIYQSSSESTQDLPGHPNQSSDTRKIQKKSSKHARPVHEKQNSKLSPGRVSKRKLVQSNIPVLTTLNASGFSADSDKKRNVHLTNEPLIDPDYSENPIHRRCFSWPSPSVRFRNRYSPLADMKEQ